jgi:GNAT superfamily N-acetyltransferase
VEGLEICATSENDIREAAEVLARAFAVDPTFAWMLPDERSRPRRLRRFFRTELRHESLRQGAVELARIDGRAAGVAVWFPPGTWNATQLGAVPGYIRAFGRRLGVAASFMTTAVRVHPHEQPHWYLAFIGVEPSLTGRGVGAALLRSRLERCDQEGVGAYLESSNPENVPLYEHFGFAVTGALDLPDGAPVVAAMWRAAVGRDSRSADRPH